MLAVAGDFLKRNAGGERVNTRWTQAFSFSYQNTQTQMQD